MPVRRSARSDAGFAITGAGLLVATLLAGCTGIPPAPPDSAPPTSIASPTLAAGEEVTPTSAPQFRPGGTAAQNLQYFTAVVQQFQATAGWPYPSQQLVNAISGAGFYPATIEVTDSKTPNGNQAVSIEASVKLGDDCLIATLRQDRAPVALMAALPTGHCLVGSD